MDIKVVILLDYFTKFLKTRMLIRELHRGH